MVTRTVHAKFCYKFRFNLGSGPVILTSLQPLVLGSLCTIYADRYVCNYHIKYNQPTKSSFMNRNDNQGVLRVTNQASVRGFSPPPSRYLNFNEQDFLLYLGMEL